MTQGSYNYDPARIREPGRDRMRFELGDTMVEGGASTAALTNEEIEAALEIYPASWKRAKLLLLENLCRKFAYQVDTKTGPLSFDFTERAKMWRKDYEALKAEVDIASPVPDSMLEGFRKPPYFYTGMQRNDRAGFGGGGPPW